MRVLISGCAGFIGTHLTKELLSQGYDVIGVDNLSTGRMENVLSCRAVGPGRFSFYEYEINQPDLYQLCLGTSIVYHLAALARVSFSIDHPIEANFANIAGTLNVLEAARKAGVSRVVFSSSSSVYGGVASFPTNEDSSLSPKSPYALQKATGETYCRLYSELHGLDTVCLRYYNVCGPGQHTGGAYSTVIPAFMSAASSGGTCVVNGDGSVLRDFTPVENVVQANLLAAQHHSHLNGEAFNVALGETYSIKDVYTKICTLAGFTVPVQYGPPRKGDPAKSHADITKAQQVLGYKPTVSFDQALENTWQWWSNGCKV